MTAPSSRFFLIVDDDDGVVRALRKMIRPFGDVVVATDFVSAKRVLEGDGRAWTAMRVDTVLPGGSGIDLLTLARRRWPILPMVLMTGYNDDTGANAAHDLGVAYVTKPWTPERVRLRQPGRLAPHRGTSSTCVWAKTRGLSVAQTDILRRASLGETPE